MKHKDPTTLELVAEAKIDSLFDALIGDRLEASGVHCRDESLYIVFDNNPNIFRIDVSLKKLEHGVELFRQRGEGIGYEDLTYDPHGRRWYCLIEAEEFEPGIYKPRVEQFDDTFRFVESRWLDFSMASANKGIEGLTTLRHQGQDYILGLCEGNACKGGRLGREPGKGRIQVFESGKREWKHAGTIKLPKAVQFEDYAALDYRHGYVTVVSQASSAMWIGRVKDKAKSLDDIFVDDGHLFHFPRDKKGRALYCNIEGVTWIADRLLAVVSDRAKANSQPGRCADKDQSVHVFRLPDSFQP